jgi:septum formation protein
MEIILASSSLYRHKLLKRLGLPFECLSPQVDETPLPGEDPIRLAQRLAKAKAMTIALQRPGALVIGSDQVATGLGKVRGKPGNLAAAAEQLRSSSGQRVSFFTGLALISMDNGIELEHVEPFHVHFRALAEAEIQGYLRREQALDCAGSFKVEGLGITLFERLEGDDPTSLEGLPLISLTRMLRSAGINPIS